MNISPLILYDSKIFLEFEGNWLQLDAITEIQGDTSITLQGPTRKTLFGYQPDIVKPRQHSSIQLTITSYITKGFPEKVFFRMAGFTQQSSRTVVLSYPEQLGGIQPKATIYVQNPHGSFCLKDCVVEGIDIPLQLDKVGQFTVTLQAKELMIIDKSIPISPYNTKKQGTHMLPQEVNARISGYTMQQVGQSCTFQRVLNTLNSVNCFNQDTLIGQGHTLLSDSNLGASIQEYLTEQRLDLPYSFEGDLVLEQQGLHIRQVRGIATRRTSIQTVHNMYWDFRATDTIEITGPQEDKI